MLEQFESEDITVSLIGTFGRVIGTMTTGRDDGHPTGDVDDTGSMVSDQGYWVGGGTRGEQGGGGERVIIHGPSSVSKKGV